MSRSMHCSVEPVCRVLLASICCVMTLCTSAVAEQRRQHLPFFHENRAFILQAWERARPEHLQVESQSRNWDYDPFVAWNAEDAVRQARAAFDSTTTPADLGAFHAALDSLLEALRLAGERLDDLDYRFAAHIRTGMELTLATPHRLDVVRVEADVEGQPVWQRDLSGAERAALQEGGILEVLRQAIEPRPYDIEVRTWVRGASRPSVTHVQFEPVPNQLVRVHLQLQEPDEPAAQQRTLVTEGS